MTEQGEVGPRGPKGSPGPPGRKGDRGATGVNNYNVSCSAGKLSNSVINIRENTSQIITALGRVEAVCISIRDTMENMLQAQEHIHYSHWHGKTHYAEDGVNVEDGMIFIPDTPDESSILVGEYQNRIDKDENGLIYGIDFIITNEDPEKPMSLRSVDDQMLNNGDSPPSVQMRWADYMQATYGG